MDFGFIPQAGIYCFEDMVIKRTQFDFTVHREEYVASLQVSVDDLVFMEVNERLQSLFTNHTDLGLGQGSLQLYGETRVTQNVSLTITGARLPLSVRVVKGLT